jgi:EpsI family protein
MSGVAARAATIAAAVESAVRREPVWIVATPLLVWLSWPTFAALHGRWLDYGYQHGHLVLGLCAWLVVDECRRAPLPAARASAWGLACLAVAGCGVVAGNAVAAQLVAEMLLPLVWIGAVWALAGWPRARRLAAPLAYLYFAVPMWDALNGSLQALTVVVVSAWLRTADVPAFIEGNFIHLPSGTFEVAGGCSGLHYVVVGAALGALLGLLNHDRWRPRIVLVAIAVGLSVFANWARVFVIVLAGHLTQMQHFLVVQDHYYFGWVLFLVLLSPLMYADRRLQDVAMAVRPQPSAGAEPSGPLSRAIAVVALMMIGFGGWFGQHVQAELERASYSPQITLVPAEGWLRADEWRDGRRPVFGAASSDDSAWLSNGVDRIGVYVASYPKQQQEHEVVHYANRPEGSAAVVVASTRRSIPIAGGGIAPFRELEVIDDDGARRLVWLQMRIAGMEAAHDVEAKLLQVGGLFIGRHDAQVVVLTAACAEDCAGARRSLTDYAARSDARFYTCAQRGPEMFSQAHDRSCD